MRLAIITISVEKHPVTDLDRYLFEDDLHISSENASAMRRRELSHNIDVETRKHWLVVARTYVVHTSYVHQYKHTYTECGCAKSLYHLNKFHSVNAHGISVCINTLCPDKNWTLDIVNNCVKLMPALTKHNAQYLSLIHI